VTAKELNEVNITVEAAINAAAVPECGTPGNQTIAIASKNVN
jgi:hypothetical protein